MGRVRSGMWDGGQGADVVGMFCRRWESGISMPKSRSLIQRMPRCSRKDAWGEERE